MLKELGMQWACEPSETFRFRWMHRSVMRLGQGAQTSKQDQPGATSICVVALLLWVVPWLRIPWTSLVAPQMLQLGERARTNITIMMGIVGLLNALATFQWHISYIIYRLYTRFRWDLRCRKLFLRPRMIRKTCLPASSVQHGMCSHACSTEWFKSNVRHGLLFKSSCPAHHADTKKLLPTNFLHRPHMSLWILIPSNGGLFWTSMASMKAM